MTPSIPPGFKLHSVWDEFPVAKLVRDRIAKYGIRTDFRASWSALETWDVLVHERDVATVKQEIRYIARKRFSKEHEFGITLGTNGYFSVQVDGGKVYKARMASHPVRVVINKQAG